MGEFSMMSQCMKAVSLGIVAFVVAVTSASSQTRLGIRGGINVATLSVSNDFGQFRDQSAYVGPVLGAIVEVNLSPLFFARAEPLYVQEGTKYSFSYSFDTYDGPGIVYNVTNPLKIEAVELPITLGVQARNGGARLYAFGGPSVGYIITSGYTKADLAAVAGVGTGIDFSSSFSMVLDVRYSIGLNNINSIHDGDVILYTRGVQPLLGIMLSL